MHDKAVARFESSRLDFGAKWAFADWSISFICFGPEWVQTWDKILAFHSTATRQVGHGCDDEAKKKAAAADFIPDRGSWSTE